MGQAGVSGECTVMISAFKMSRCVEDLQEVATYQFSGCALHLCFMHIELYMDSYVSGRFKGVPCHFCVPRYPGCNNCSMWSGLDIVGRVITETVFLLNYTRSHKMSRGRPESNRGVVSFPCSALASYGAYVRPMSFANELGLQMLIGGVYREGSLRNMHVEPVFSHYSFHGPVFRVMLRVLPSKIPHKK